VFAFVKKGTRENVNAGVAIAGKEHANEPQEPEAVRGGKKISGCLLASYLRATKGTQGKT